MKLFKIFFLCAFFIKTGLTFACNRPPIRVLNSSTTYTEDRTLTRLECQADLVKTEIHRAGYTKQVKLVSSASELKNALLAYTGEGEYRIEITHDIKEPVHIDYRTKPKFAKPLLITSRCRNKHNHCKDIDRARLNILNVKNADHLIFHKIFINRMNILPNRTSGFVHESAWNFQNSSRIKLHEVLVQGRKDILPNRPVTYYQALNDPQGIRFSNSKDISVTKSIFHHLFYGIVYKNIDNLVAKGNYFDFITSDAFHGGGLQNALFKQNYFFTKVPVKVRVRGAFVDVHSDFVQIHNHGTNSSHNVSIVENVSFPGSLKSDPHRIVGWQCFFIKNERNGNDKHKRIRVVNNTCATNQYHGVTFQGVEGGKVLGNTIVPTFDAVSDSETYNDKTFRRDLASIRFTDSKNIAVNYNQSTSIFTGKNEDQTDGNNSALKIFKNTTTLALGFEENNKLLGLNSYKVQMQKKLHHLKQQQNQQFRLMNIALSR